MNHRTLIAFLAVSVFTLAGCSTNPPAGQRADHADTYEIQIVLTETNAGQVHALTNPRIIVSEGQPASVQIDGDAQVYRFETVVTRNDGQVTATTTAKMTRNGILTSSPTVRQVVGQDAEIQVDTMHMLVKVLPANGA